MKTLRGKSAPNETAMDFVRALESATELWDQGHAEAATKILRQAARAAARAGDETRAKKLEQLFHTLESARQLGTSHRASDDEPESQPDTLPSVRQEAKLGTDVRLRPPPYSVQSMSRTQAVLKGSTETPRSESRRSTMPAEADVDKSPTSDGIWFAHSSPSSGPVPYPRPDWFERDGSSSSNGLDPRPARPAASRSRRVVQRLRHRRRTHVRARDSHVFPAFPEDEVPTSSVRDPAVRVAVRSAFSKLPPNARSLLRRTAVRVDLVAGATMPDFGIAFLSRGSLCAHPDRSDRCAVAVQAGTLVLGGPGIAPTVSKRWVACNGPASLTVWDQVAAAKLMFMAPGLGQWLRSATRRIDALVGATQGPLGEKFCRSIRAALLTGATLKMLVPNETLVAKGFALPGLVVTGAGCLLQIDGPRICELPPGTVPCVTAVLSRSPAPVSLRAGDAGASVLVTNLRTAHELFCTMPALLDLLSHD